MQRKLKIYKPQFQQEMSQSIDLPANCTKLRNHKEDKSCKPITLQAMRTVTQHHNTYILEAPPKHITNKGLRRQYILKKSHSKILQKNPTKTK